MPSPHHLLSHGLALGQLTIAQHGRAYSYDTWNNLARIITQRFGAALPGSIISDLLPGWNIITAEIAERFELPLHLCIPQPLPPRSWCSADRQVWSRLCSHAWASHGSVTVISDAAARRTAMLAKATTIFALYPDQPRFTSHPLMIEAQAKGLPIINCFPQFNEEYL